MVLVPRVVGCVGCWLLLLLGTCVQSKEFDEEYSDAPMPAVSNSNLKLSMYEKNLSMFLRTCVHFQKRSCVVKIGSRFSEYSRNSISNLKPVRRTCQASFDSPGLSTVSWDTPGL